MTQAEINEKWLSVDDLKVGLGGRTARGGAIVMGAQVARIIIQLATTFVLARLLTPDDFGLIAIGYTILGLLNIFTDLSLTSVTVQLEKLEQQTSSGLLMVNVVLALVALMIAALGSPLLAMAFDENRIPAVAIGLAVSAPLGALGAQHSALLMRNMKWGLLQTISIVSMFAGSIVAVLSAWLADAGYWSLVIQASVSASVGTAGAWTFCTWRPSPIHTWSGTLAALRTSLNLSGTTVLSFIHRQMDNILIGWRWGTTELGFYARSYSLLMMPLNLVTGPLTSAILPALSRLQDDPPRWRLAYLDALIIVTALGGGIAALMFGGAGAIVDIILGPGWEKSERIFSALVLAMLAATPMNTVVWIYVSLGRSGRMFQWGLIGASIYVASFFIGLPFGAVGVATAYGIAQITAFTPCLWMATRGTSVTMGDVLKAVLPITLTTVAIGWGLKMVTAQVGLILDVVAIGLAGLVYVTVLGLICSTWPPYRRVYDRATTLLGPRLRWLIASRTR